MERLFYILSIIFINNTRSAIYTALGIFVALVFLIAIFIDISIDK